MTIEELSDSRNPRRATESQWLTTVSALGAGIAIGVVFMWSIGPQAVPAPSSSPAESAGITRASLPPATPRPSPLAANVVASALRPSARQSLNVDGVPFSFSVPAAGWTRYGDLYISKNSRGPQNAEAMIFWASYPFGQYAWACDEALYVEVDTTAAEFAAGLATGLLGTELVAGPTEVILGGLAATQVVLRVRDDPGCGPGFFYTWDGEDSRGGSVWGRNKTGDTISIWVFDAGGERFIIAAQSHPDAGAELEAEVQQIVDSIEFEPGLEDRAAIRFAEALTPSVRHALTTDGVSLTYSVPASGWARYDELYVSRDTVGSQAAEAMVLWARYPDGRSAQACDWSGDRPDGTTAASLAASLSTGVPGTELVGEPTEVTVGGIAATRVVLSVRDQSACGRGYFLSWKFAGGGPFWHAPAPGDTITIWVLDMATDLFVIVTETRKDAGAWLEAEAQQIVDSIEFEAPETNPMPGDYTSGRHSTTVDSTTFSFAIATDGWEPYPWEGAPLGSTLISKNIRGSQGAEEVIYWAGYPNSIATSPCGVLQDPTRPPSALGVATRLATAAGIDLDAGPEEVTVGGHSAAHVVVTVREALGCDPGYFYSWAPQRGGALWTGTRVGATIRVWVVEVDGGLFFICAATTPEAAGREQEIQHIIDSIEFAQ